MFPLTLYSHSHLVLNKYFTRDIILFTIVQLIIFLYAKSSFMFSHLLFTHSSLQFLISYIVYAQNVPKDTSYIQWATLEKKRSSCFTRSTAWQVWFSAYVENRISNF
jgi:hypothetical protein